MNNKKGISLIVLVITIVVLGILASAAIFVSADLINNSKKSALSADLQQIEDLVKEYKLANNGLPVYNGLSYDKATLISLISEGANILSDEITSNGDDTSVFYKIDMSQISVDSSKRGVEESGDATDIYVVAEDSLNVYYLRGEKIVDEYYFSLTEKLTGKSKISNEQSIDTSEINISNTTGVINLKKNTNDWTNSLTIDVQTVLSTGETLKYYIAGKDITSSVKNNKVDASSILLADETLKTLFYENEDNKELMVQKIRNEEVVAQETISLTNLDLLSGNTISQGNVVHTKYDKYIAASVSGYSDLGGSLLKETRVLYKSKLNADGTTQTYYTDLPTQITNQFVYNAGVKSNGILIKLPTDVAEYYLVFVDNAGNISAVNTITVTY